MALDISDHRLLALWAVDCAERVLPFFEEAHPDDDRPRKALEAARAWVRGEVRVGEVRTAALAAHAAARAADGADAARAAARAAGQAAGTAHVPGHAAAAATYASTAVACAAAVEECAWQLARLPEHLRPVGFPARTEGPKGSTRLLRVR